MKTSPLKLLVTIVCLLVPSQAFADAQSCIDGALRAAKVNINNQRVLGALFDLYFGEAFARFPVRRDWPSMSQAERDDQISYARNIIVSEAAQLAEFANADIKFVVDSTNNHVVHGFMKKDKTSRKITVFMGAGCRFIDVEVEGYPKLSSTISDVRRLIKK